MLLDLFHLLVATHIIAGATGLITVWLAIASRKGGLFHRQWGDVFCKAIFVAGGCAVAMAILSLIDPHGTHPHVTDMSTALIRDLFGWMMLYLGMLTLGLVLHGLDVVQTRRPGAGRRRTVNAAMQLLTVATAANCAIQGAMIGQPLMIGISVIGFLSPITNALFFRLARPSRAQIWKEHAKALVGGGISTYTAFLAFGLVRAMPEHAFNPALWALPTLVGVSIILFHWWKIDAGARRATTGLS
jgi:hypothetical protein